MSSKCGCGILGHRVLPWAGARELQCVGEASCSQSWQWALASRSPLLFWSVSPSKIISVSLKCTLYSQTWEVCKLSTVLK